MSDPEEAERAVERWRRYEREVSSDLLRAVCGAFAVVLAADGVVSHEEIDRFVAFLHRRTDDFPALDLAATEHCFRELADAILTAPEVGRRRALAEVARVRYEPEACELVRSAAVIAVVADRRVAPGESEALRQVCEALGIAPEKSGDVP